METEPAVGANIKEVVPFFLVSDIERSIRFYVDGLGFRMTLNWVDRGKLRWCMLRLGGAALMLQGPHKEATDGHEAWSPSGKLGEGVSIVFMCEDALAIYRESLSRGLRASEPFVGNKMWVVSLSDPDGYRIDFESDTDVPEETKLSEWEG